MKTISISEYQNTYRSKLKVPNRVQIVQSNKQEYINKLKTESFADIFEEFEKNLRTIMETFIYTIKY